MDDWLYPLLRFGHYAVLLGLFGIIAFRSIGLRQTMALKPNWEGGPALVIAAVMAPVLTIALMLVSVTAMMAQTVWQLEWATIETLVMSTSIGWAFMVRLGLLVAAASTLMLSGRSPFPGSVAAVLFGLALSTLPWNGHAAATEGTLGLIHRLNDAVHLLAAGLWIGAIGWFVCLTRAAHNRPDHIAPAPLLSDMHKFAPLGALLVAVVAISGLLNAHLIFGLGNSAAILKTDYGWLLAAKIGLVGFMLVFAARNAILGRRHSNTSPFHSDKTVSTLAQLRISLAAEATLAVAVIGAVAFIGTMSPWGH